jgi:hypothetical protein
VSRIALLANTEQRGEVLLFVHSSDAVDRASEPSWADNDPLYIHEAVLINADGRRGSDLLALNAAGIRACVQCNDCPAGKSPSVAPVQSPPPREKIFRLTRRANHRYSSARLTR